MFLGLLFSLSSSEVFTCTHEYDSDSELRSMEPKSLIRKTHEIQDKDSQFRVCFDYASIDDSSYDSTQCTSTTGTCQSTDILDDSKRSVIKETFANVKKFLEDNINVTKTPDGEISNNIGTSMYSKTYEFKEATNNECDLLIVVYARPFGSGSSGLAYASSLSYSSIDGRPIIGKITVNPTKLPTEAQSFDSGARQFITTVLHEINHVLSFSSSLFKKWLDSDGKEYGDDVFRYADEDGNVIDSSATDKVIHTFLTTPHLTKWANERFHVSEENSEKYGLEIEDGGGSGTAGAHPNERLYFTDLMQGRTYGPGYVGPIFYNTLLDTNWYIPSTGVIEKLTYLDDTLEVDSTTTESILYGPPIKNFPSSHICDTKQQTSCFYDYIYSGICALKDVSSLSDAQLTADPYKSYYRPNSESTVGQDDLLDYVPTVLPWYNCRDSGAGGKDKKGYSSGESPEDYGEYYGNQSVCAMSTLYHSSLYATFSGPRCFDSYCGDDMRVRIVVDGVEKVCNKDGKKLKWDGYSGSVVCPPSSVVCANRKEYKEVLAITAMTPDRGPIDGKNLVSIEGTKFGNYTKENLTIKFGEVICDVLMVKETELLCKVRELTEEQKSQYYQKSVTISAHDAISGKNSTSTFMYTFTGRSYDAGSISAKPAIILLALSSIIAFFFF